MVRKSLAAVILVPLALAMVGLAVANRAAVTVSFDPFNSTSPAYTLQPPLFVLALVLVMTGVIVGGIAAWLRQGKWRRAARRFEFEARAARAEAEALRRRLDAGDVRPTALPIALRPPAA